MEGTKNERSVVIIASYVIGFITGFILLYDYSTIENSSAVIYTTENIDSSSSVQNETIPLPDYTQKAFASASENGDYVFYCEKLDPSEAFCYGYIYQQTTGIVHQVSIDNSPLSITENNLPLLGWVEGKLTIGDFSSFSAEEPWLLIDNTTPIDLQQ